MSCSAQTLSLTSPYRPNGEPFKKATGLYEYCCVQKYCFISIDMYRVTQRITCIIYIDMND